jgi:hypothetical protein
MKKFPAPGGRTERGPRDQSGGLTELAETMAGRSVKETLAQIRHGVSGALRALALGSAAAKMGHFEIDNNATKHSLCTVAVARKNYLFAGSDVGGERAVANYTLFGTAKLNGLDPEAYLRNVLSRIDELPPWNFGPNPVEQSLRTG